MQINRFAIKNLTNIGNQYQKHLGYFQKWKSQAVEFIGRNSIISLSVLNETENEIRICFAGELYTIRLEFETALNEELTRSCWVSYLVDEFQGRERPPHKLAEVVVDRLGKIGDGIDCWPWAVGTDGEQVLCQLLRPSGTPKPNIIQTQGV
jgi:hypothetical protein